MTIKWLHLSDVHESSRDAYHRTAMYDAIVDAVKAADRKPDIVFMTGDLAFAGTEAEYALLRKRFIDPLKAALPAGCRLFMTPGNHDLDRTRGTKPRLWMVDEDESNRFEEVGPGGRSKRADTLLPRFAAYRAFEAEVADWGEDWLASDQGAICKLVELDGRRLAIVGLNTAWLCQDDEDWSKLTPGRTMLESALKQAAAEKPDAIIALGHHPLAAMTGEAPWAARAIVQTQLEQASALYLHGHLHMSGAQRSGEVASSALAIQAPSAFQAADSSIWRNGILWGELCFETGRVILSPQQWNNTWKAYVFDSDAMPPRFRVPGQDAFALPVPWAAPTTSSPRTAQPDPSRSILSPGWERVDAEDLAAKTATKPSAKAMSDWFDGQFARWETAAAEGVRPRRVVEDIVRRFEAVHTAAPLPLAVLVTGAGGEGKSTALLQIAAGLLREGKNWTCLWRSAAAAALPDGLIEGLEEQPGHAWIVLIDDAETVAAHIPAALRRIQPRTDVHFILGARDADWSIRGLAASMWNGVATFNRFTLAGLDAEDSQRIATGWVAYGAEAMGRLSGQTVEMAAKALLGHAQEQAAKKEEGALLGALLITREGEDLRNRVVRLMEPWAGAEGIGDWSLLDIYAMIAAMHAENQLYLSKTVLAFALGCEESLLDQGPLRVLRREAMVDGSETYVLTRHRRIAEAARDWLVENQVDVDRLYPFLAKAALREFRERYSRNPDISKWQYGLQDHFLQRGPTRWAVAIAVAKALSEMDSGNPLLFSSYASTLRRADHPKAAFDLLRAESKRFGHRRDIVYEWSVSARDIKDPGLSAWLAGRSLADDRNESVTQKQAKLSLAGLGLAFELIREKTGGGLFARAQSACGRLGMLLPDLDPTARSYFERYQTVAPPPMGAARPTIDADLLVLKTSIIEAANDCEPGNDPPFFETLLGDPEGYSFRHLKSALQATGD